MKFAKYQGLGNDFVLVDADRETGVDFHRHAAAICDRHFGIGADGVITLRSLGGNAFEMRIINSDGSEAAMCGNGTRCAAKFIRKYLRPDAEAFEFHTLSGIVRPALCGDRVRVDMGEPKYGAVWTELETPSGKFRGTEVSMGNPHFIVPLEPDAALELEKWGAELELHPHFPDRSNIEFVRTPAPDQIRMRVWERGCGVTLACGTGSCAATVAGVLTGRSARKVTVALDGGELTVEWSETDNHVYMTGEAAESFTGEWIAEQ